MRVLVLGGSGSGKSIIAENIAVRLANGGLLYYLATMRVYGEEDTQRVERHRDMRGGKGFVTVEKPADIGGFAPESSATVLLECLSNLLANEMFSEKRAQESAAEKILAEIKFLSATCRNLVVVSADVFRDGRKYEKSVEEYIASLGRLNRELTRGADVVIESAAGIPIFLKGKEVYEKLF